MADAIFSGLLSPDDEATVVDFLGRSSPVSTKGAATLPVGGAPVSGGTGPVSPGGTGVAPAPGATPGAPSKPSAPGDAAGLAKLGVNVAEKLGKLFGKTPSGVQISPEIAEAAQKESLATSGGGVSATPPELLELTGTEFKIPPGVLEGTSGGALAPAAEGAATTPAATETSAGLAEPGLAGILAQEAGVGVNVGLRAQGKTPAAEQANLAAIEALMATTGAGALAIPLTEMTLSGQFGKPGSPIDYATSGAVSIWSDLYGGGRYAPTRKAAFSGATEGLKDFGNQLTAAAKSADPADALKSLQGGGPVRAGLTLPEEAKAAGLPTGPVEFANMNTEQFNKLLSWYAEDPSRIAATVGGSGDVPYLPARQAQQVADQAGSGAQQLLTFLVNRKIVQEAMQAAQPEAAPAPAPAAAPPATPAGGGPLGLAEIGLEVGR